MAKRYKEKKKNKFLLYLTSIAIILVIAYLVYNFFIKKNDEQSKNVENTQTNNAQVEQQLNIDSNTENKESNSEQDSLDDESNDNIPLSGDILVPKDLESEVRNKLEEEIKDAEVVRIHYQLKTLEDGIIRIYYKLDDEKIYSAKVDIASKEIAEFAEIEDEELVQKSTIEDNLEEDVKQDFETYKDRLNGENSRLNIIISNTEIIINVSYV